MGLEFIDLPSGAVAVSLHSDVWGQGGFMGERTYYPQALRRAIESGELPCGTLGGEVLGAWRQGGTLCLDLRDKSESRDITVRVESPLGTGALPERGTMVFVPGELVREPQVAPLGIQFIWRGEKVDFRGPSDAHRKRIAYIEDEAQRVEARLKRIDRPFTGRLIVLTGKSSKAYRDVEAVLSKKHFLRRNRTLHKCSLDSSESIASGIWNLLSDERLAVRSDDIVLITRGGGDWKDLRRFEHEKVVTALAVLATHCVTCLAIGHASDKLLLERVVGHVFDTPSGAVSEIDRLTYRAKKRFEEQDAIRGEPPAAVPGPLREGAGWQTKRGAQKVKKRRRTTPTIRPSRWRAPGLALFEGGVCLALTYVAVEKGHAVAAAFLSSLGVMLLCWAAWRSLAAMTSRERFVAVAAMLSVLWGASTWTGYGAGASGIATSQNAATASAPARPGGASGSARSPRAKLKTGRAGTKKRKRSQRAMVSAIRQVVAPFSLTTTAAHAQTVCIKHKGRWSFDGRGERDGHCMLSGHKSYAISFTSKGEHNGELQQLRIQIPEDSPVPLLAHAPLDKLVPWIDQLHPVWSVRANAAMITVVRRE